MGGMGGEEWMGGCFGQGGPGRRSIGGRGGVRRHVNVVFVKYCTNYNIIIWHIYLKILLYSSAKVREGLILLIEVRY